MKIGIDLGGSHVAVGIISEEGKIIAKQEKNIVFANQTEEEIKQIIRDSILSLINNLKNILQMPIFIAEEICVGIPGIVENNIIKNCSKYGIYDWNLAEELTNLYKVDTTIVNDAVASAMAEIKYGNLQECRKGVFLCFGTGIGGVNILDGEIFSSEYGHMVIEKDGIKCHCGRKGCYENYASMKVFKQGLIKLLDLKETTTSQELLFILKSNPQDEKINNYIDEYLDKLLIGLENIVNIINPDKICIGGSFAYFDDILYKKLLNKVKNGIYQYKIPDIVLAKFKNDSGIIGACIKM